MNRIGEKLLEWTDVDPPVEKILQLVTLWWLTETFPRSIYPYREVTSPAFLFLPFSSISLFFSCCVVLESADTNKLFTPGNSLTPTTLKPFGYSLFPKELVPTPKSWVDAETNGKMIWCKRHDHVCTQDPSVFFYLS